MPLKLYFLPSYERCGKKLGSGERKIAGLAVSALKSYFELGLPFSGNPYVFKTHGRSWRLVFEKLRAHIWEAYIEGRARILAREEEGQHFLVFAGNHDQVRQFLKTA